MDQNAKGLAESKPQATDDALAQLLATWLTEVEERTIAVDRFERVSAGARRLNALFDLVDDRETHRRSLTLNQTADIEIITVTTEAQVRAIAEQAGVPVPHIHHVCEHAEILGGPFFISTAVAGLTIPRQVVRFANKQSLGSVIVHQLGTAMARLHTADVTLVPIGIPVPERASPVSESLTRLDERMALLQQPSPTFALAARWLERHAPTEPERLAIVHGDIRVGNIIVDDSGLAAILDWETCHVGDPLEDPAWSTVRMWRFRHDEQRVGGLGSIHQLRTAYVDSGGEWDDDRFEWWRLLLTVRWGISLADQARSHLDGRYKSIVMAASGRRVAELEYDALMLLNPTRTTST